VAYEFILRSAKTALHLSRNSIDLVTNRTTPTPSFKHPDVDSVRNHWRATTRLKQWIEKRRVLREF
jgi:hypothetical protein